MARPAGPTRARILDAAQELFAERGFGATSTQAITERAGVAAGSLFYHFDNKAGLLTTLLAERGFAPDLDRVLADADPDDPRGTLTALGRSLLEAVDQRREVVQLSLQEALRRSTAGQDLQDLLRDEFALLGTYLAVALPDRLDGRRSVVLARAFLCTLVFEATIVGSHLSREEFLATTIDTLVPPG